jgi:prolipoprotein diacylglyceryltransferase
MESIFLCLLFLFFVWLRPRKRFHGQIFFLYMMIYPLGRFFFEMFRADDIRGFVTRIDASWLNSLLGLSTDKPLMLTTSQFISLLVVAGSGWLFFRARKASLGSADEILAAKG